MEKGTSRGLLLVVPWKRKPQNGLRVLEEFPQQPMVQIDSIKACVLGSLASFNGQFDAVTKGTITASVVRRSLSGLRRD